MAAMSCTRAGKSACCAARETVMVPHSSGSRRTSSTRRRTRPARPGTGPRDGQARSHPAGGGCQRPPGPRRRPCDARNGRRLQLSGRKPWALTECTAADSRASCSSMGGRIPGRARASMVLPVPRGPTIRHCGTICQAARVRAGSEAVQPFLVFFPGQTNLTILLVYPAYYYLASNLS